MADQTWRPYGSAPAGSARVVETAGLSWCRRAESAPCRGVTAYPLEVFAEVSDDALVMATFDRTALRRALTSAR
ncbi:hypothetical protein [Streptomyces avermitilis]|uniref:hypothetical protein n=1 Tax=Streptomyces avermitilis TaxID=33903 RepID=UPI0037F7CE14